MRLGTLGWMLVVTSVVMAGCSASNVDDDRCARDADCGLGRRCETATGQCQAKVERNLSCADASDCLASEHCHPTAKVCVRTCVSGADCSDSAKTCDVLSDTDSRKVCKCSTDALCNADRSTPDLVCSVPDAVCTPKCTSDAECNLGYVCDTATGHCKVWGGTSAPCTGEGQSNCDYGTHSCNLNLCQPFPAPTCMNYENFPRKDELGTTATILYGARQVSAGMDTAACGTAMPKRVRIALSAYSNQPFPALRDGLSGFFRVKTDGSSMSAVPLLFSGTDYTVSGANRERAELVVSICVDAASTTLSAAFYFTGGNFICFQANYN